MSDDGHHISSTRIRELIKDTQEYYEFANNNTILFALIESKESVENIDDILEVEGIDATWLGPSDMALSMGLPGKDHVKEHLDLVVEKTIQNQLEINLQSNH